MNQRQVPEGRSFVPPPVEHTRPSALGSAPKDEEIPEALMFDKANEAESIDQARQQVQLVVDEIADTRKARDEAADPRARARLDERLAILDQQRERFGERLDVMIREAGQDVPNG